MSTPIVTERLLALVVVLNLFDGVATLGSVSAGLAIEANPLMAEALTFGPILFMCTKLSMVCLGVLLLHRLLRYTAQRWWVFGGAVCATCVYGYIAVRHVDGLLP